MKTRRNILSMTALAAAVTGVIATGALAQTATSQAQAENTDAQKTKAAKITAKIGEAAPAFTLTDAKGKEYQLSDYKGKIVVLQWINPGCPVCVRCSKSGVIANMRKQLKEVDASCVHLTINSTAGMKSPEDGASYLKKYKLDMPALNDKDGTVGHLYGAKTTPHMFVIDQKGVLRYSGAIDDDRNGSKGNEATNYVVNAVRQISAGETVAPDETKSYGCSVKYASKGGGKGRRGRRGGG